MNMADRIQYLRKTKGFSQEQLTDKVGISRQDVSKWESGQSSPDLEKIIIMSELFEVTTDYILKVFLSWQQEQPSDDLHDPVYAGNLIAAERSAKTIRSKKRQHIPRNLKKVS